MVGCRPPVVNSGRYGVVRSDRAGVVDEDSSCHWSASTSSGVVEAAAVQ